MENSLYVGISRQMVLRNAMDMVANNVANMSTPGYRAQNPIFKEYLSKPAHDKETLSMVEDYGQWSTTSPGTTQFTGGTYDVALNGPGYIGITAPDGTMMYTRGGNFTTNSQNQIVTSAGMLVGTGINIPAGAKDVKITETGEVVADNNTVGQIPVMEFDNLQMLKPQGNGLYSAEGGRPATETTMKQGMIEGSNVNGVLEMTRMIEILRDFQSTQAMLKSEDERQRGAIQKLAQANQ